MLILTCMVDVTQFPNFPNYKTAVPGWIADLSSPFRNQSERLERTKPKLLPHLSPLVLPRFSDPSYIVFRWKESRQQATDNGRRKNHLGMNIWVVVRNLTRRQASCEDTKAGFTKLDMTRYFPS